VTDKGSPSGIAITRTATPKIKNYRISTKCSTSNDLSRIRSIMNLMISTDKIRIAEISPNLPISLAMVSNFYYKGVTSTSFYLNIAPILPSQVLSPTNNTMNKPSPYKHLVPLITIGDGTS
jgi:hypothetical protein